MHTLGLVVHTYNFSTPGGEARGQKFKVILFYVLNLRPAWIAQDPVSENKRIPLSSNCLHTKQEDEGHLYNLNHEFCSTTINIIKLCIHNGWIL